MTHPREAHNAAHADMLQESRADLERAQMGHWRRVLANDCRDSEGDLVIVPEWARERLDPPKYKVEPQRWAGTWAADENERADPKAYTPGPLTGSLRGDATDPPQFVWAREGDAGYPPQAMITAGVTGTESVFADQVHGSEKAARLSAWADYDARMAPTWQKRIYPGG